MLTTDIIAKKRDCQRLEAAEIEFIVQGVVEGTIPDYQIAAWAMAVLCRGMDEAETALLTHSMLASGGRLRRVSDRPRVDKHSTGGLGDKVSLVLAPLLACFDVEVPMLSGRGLGITGGTLDKLESFSGYRCDLSQADIEKQLLQIGCAITGTTPDIAPADRKLYALRDVSGTVPSIPLITSSIMCKKLAETLDALVLDVKFGSAAFMRNLDDARLLGNSLRQTGERMGVKTQVILSDMNQPLGRMVGNACEVNEALDVLKGGGPADVRELTLQLGSSLLCSAGIHSTSSESVRVLNQMLDGGLPLERFERMVELQGGKFSDELALARSSEFSAWTSGWIQRFDGQSLGNAVVELGGGRRRLSAPIDHAVGLEMLVRIGDEVQAGQPLVRIFSNDVLAIESVQRRLRTAIAIADHPVEPLRLVVEG